MGKWLQEIINVEMGAMGKDGNWVNVEIRGMCKYGNWKNGEMVVENGAREGVGELRMSLFLWRRRGRGKGGEIKWKRESIIVPGGKPKFPGNGPGEFRCDSFHE